MTRNLADITYQQNKGAMAIGTGGLTGTGLFTPEHIFVPNAWNDFIFAYLANVLGFVARRRCWRCCWGCACVR